MNINAFGNVSDKMISEFEHHIGFTLPEDYREFLLKYNGGTSQKRYSTFFVKELNQEISLDVLFGLNVDKLDLQKWNDEFVDDMLENTIIIGDDPGGGLIVLINGLDMKGVYYWDDSFNFEQSSEERNIYKVADSFHEFIEVLKNPL